MEKIDERADRMNRVVIVGPESSGKTTLAEHLSKHFQQPLVPEYAREYINQLHRSYNFEDLQIIGAEQVRLEEKAKISNSGKFLVCDTDILVVKVWAMDKFGKLPEVARTFIPQPGDLYLITMSDLPWKPDPQRENPEDRDRIFALYIEELEQFSNFYQIIDGSGDSRFEKAISAIEHHFQFPKDNSTFEAGGA